MGVEEVLKLVRPGDGRPLGLRHPELLETRAHHELVLREPQRTGAGPDGDSGIDEGGEHVLRHVLVVEGDDVDVAREGEDGVGVAVVPDGGGREGCRHPLVFGEHAQLDSELDRGRDHHAGELTAADDSDTQRHGTPSLTELPSSRTRARREGSGWPAGICGSGSSRCARIWLTST